MKKVEIKLKAIVIFFTSKKKGVYNKRVLEENDYVTITKEFLLGWICFIISD